MVTTTEKYPSTSSAGGSGSTTTPYRDNENRINTGLTADRDSDDIAWNDTETTASGQQVQQQARRIKAEFSDLLNDVEELVSRGTSLSGEALTELKNRLTERVKKAKTQVNGLSGNVSQYAGQYLDSYENYVRAQPLKAVGIALAIGAGVGVLLRSRR